MSAHHLQKVYSVHLRTLFGTDMPQRLVPQQLIPVLLESNGIAAGMDV